MNLIKRVLIKIFVIVFGFLMISVGLNINFSFAQNVNQTSQSSQPNTEKRNKALEGFVRVVDALLKVIVILISPLLIVAGWALSNDFVTGSLFYIDDALRHFWQVMRNISMFIIGFMAVFSILAYLIFQKSTKYSPKEIIPKILLAVIAVNASWWIIGLLISLSTVLTISFGTLPLQIVGKNGEKLMVYKTFSYIPNKPIQIEGLDTPIRNITLYQLSGEIYIAPCLLSDGKIVEQYTWLKYTRALENSLDRIFRKKYLFDFDDCLLIDDKGVKIINLGSCFGESPSKCEEIRKGSIKVENLEQTSLYPLISKIQNFVGPLYFFYGSLVNFWGIRDYVIGGGVGIGSITMLFIIKIILAIILLLPLVALAVVLVMRGFLLWFIIAFSPLLFLVWTLDVGKLKGLVDKFSLSNVLALIFLPVTVTLAMSIGIVILSVFNGLITQAKNDNNDGISAMERSLGINIRKQETQSGAITILEMPGGAKISFIDTAKKIGSDIGESIGAIFLAVMASMIVWAVVFAALKTSSLTASIVDTVEAFGKGLASTVPIVPTPWGMQSIGSLEKAADSIRSIPETIAKNQYDKSPINEFFDKMSSTMSGKKEEWKKQVQNAKDLKQLDSYVKNIPQGYSLADDEIFKVVKAKLAALAQDESLKEKINSLRSFSDLGKYPEIVDWLKENKVDIKSWLSISSVPSYAQTKYKRLLKDFGENLEEASGLEVYTIGDRKIYLQRDLQYAYMVDTKNPSDIIFYDLDKNPEDLKSFIKYISTIKFDKKGELLEKIKDFIQKKVNEGKTSEEKLNKFKELLAVNNQEAKVGNVIFRYYKGTISMSINDNEQNNKT